MTKPRLYALLVGINNYQDGIRPLFGCKNDVHKFSQYLKDQADHFEVDLAPPLLDQDATKAKIVEQFLAHLGQAQAGDTALFYFSGHGCREDADPALWPREQDRLLEGLVCYHPEPNNEGDVRNRVGPEVLLADKELRYMIWELTRQHPKDAMPHVVVIVDCCHSGDVTRNVLAGGKTTETRKVEVSAKQRARKAFIFSDEWLHQTQEKPGLSGVDYLEGQHIHLAACQAHQLAKEDFLDREGVGVGDPDEKTGIFTHHLLQFVQQNGSNVSYYDIHTRLKIFTRFRFEQVPQVYVPTQSQAWLNKGFLNRPLTPGSSQVGRVHYDDKQGWILNLGALHGISRRASIRIQLGDSGVDAQTQTVSPDISILQLQAEAEAQLDRSKSYPCQLEGLRCEPLNLCIHNEDLMPEQLEELKTKLEAGIKGLNFIDVTSESSYTLHIVRGEYRLAQPELYRPIVAPIKIAHNNAKDELLRYLKQISQWEYVKGLQSEAIDQLAFPKGMPLDIQVQLEQEDGNFAEWPKKLEDLVVLPLREISEGEWKGNFKIHVKNRYDRRLWVAALYLDTDYSIITLLDQKVQVIEPGGDWELLESAIGLKPHFYDYNWAIDLSRIKFIVSTQDNIEVEHLLMEEGLPLPECIESDKGLLGNSRGIVRSENLAAKEGWITQDLVLQIPNPLYNTISRAKLKAMMLHPVLQEYANAIYVEPKLTLKKGISWNDKTETNA